MAKAVSAEFKAAAANKYGQKVVMRAFMKRRYLVSASPLSYVYESSWVDIGRWFSTFPAITRQLDTPFRSRFRISEVTLRLANTHNEWIPSAAIPSMWAADDISGEDGYFAPQTKFLLQFGYILQDGSKEYTDQFTGYLIKPKPTGHAAYVDLKLVSGMFKLQHPEAALVSEAFPLENCQPAAGTPGGETHFQSTSKAVSHFTQVPVDAVDQDQGSDWEASNLDDVDEGELDFRVAPPNNDSVQCAGVKWKENQKLNVTVEDLYDAGGVTAGERTVDAVSLPAIAGSKTIDSQGEWQAGAFGDEIEATSEPGSILLKRLDTFGVLDDFEDGDYTSDPVWTVAGGVWSVVSFLASLMLRNGALGAANQTIRTPSTQDNGVWEFVHAYINPNQTNAIPYPSGVVGGFDFRFMEVDASNYYNIHGAAQSGLANPIQAFFIIKVVAGVPSSLGNFILAGGVYKASTRYTWRITRDNGTGEMKLYLDGVLKLTKTDGIHTTSAQVVCRGDGATGAGNAYNYFDDIRKVNVILETTKMVPATGTWESAAQDLLSPPTAWLQLDRTHTLNGGTVTYATNVASAPGGPYDGWVNIAGDGTIQSALKRYIKVRAILTPNAGFTATPKVTKLVINFTSSDAFLAVANHKTGKILDKLELYAKIPDHEIGVDDSDHHFWRRKVTGVSQLTLNQENWIIDVVDWDPGWDNVGNSARVKYGNYVETYDKDDAGESEPTSERKYLRRVIEDDLSGVILANDLALAAARAQILYENNFLPKRRLVLKVWLPSWLELSDVVTVDYFDHPIMKAMFAYDPLMKVGPYMAMGEHQNVLARDLDMRILELTQDEIDPNKEGGITATLVLEEVLS